MTSEKPPKDFFLINRSNLDEHCIEQVDWMAEYAFKLADAKDELERSKAQMEVIKLKICKQIRDDPEAYGIEGRCTEGAIEEALSEEQSYRLEVNRTNEAKHLVGIMQAAVDALKCRKDMLQQLINLHGMDYFSKPSVSEETREKSGLRKQTKDRKAAARLSKKVTRLE